MDNINWYPGHMKKTRETIKKNLKLVDAVIEIIDARIPVSSRNPIIDELAENKQRIIVLNKSDLSDKKANLLWIDALKNENASSNINGSAHNNEKRGDGSELQNISSTGFYCYLESYHYNSSKIGRASCRERV